MGWRHLATGLSVALGAAACGGPTAGAGAQVRQLRAQLDQMRRSQHELTERLTRLEDHAYALEDRLARSAEPPARLPVVRLRPSDAPEVEPSPPDVDAPTALTEPPGSATSLPNEPRPVLRIRGPSFTAAPVAPHPTAERLAVTPLPGERPEAADRPAVRPAVLLEDPLAAVRAYEQAYALVRQRRLDDALGAFDDFLRRYPHHPYADNALYWRGECYYARGEWLRAVGEFERLVTRFPEGNKIADALLKLGLCFQRLGDSAQANRWFGRLRSEFPQTDAAAEAGRRLAERASGGAP